MFKQLLKRLSFFIFTATFFRFFCKATPVAREDLLELFQQLVKGGERSILFSTHITSDLDKCADAITYIKNGKVLASAEKAAFLRSFQSLKQPGEGDLTLEDIMVRNERRTYDV